MYLTDKEQEMSEEERGMSAMMPDKIKQMFNSYDTDGSGFIDQSELKELLKHQVSIGRRCRGKAWERRGGEGGCVVLRGLRRVRKRWEDSLMNWMGIKPVSCSLIG